MKKKIICILLVFCFNLCILSAQAYIQYEDIAGGKNLLNLSTMYAAGNRDQGYSDEHYFSVKAGYTYTIVMDYAYANNFLNGCDEFEYEAYPSGNPGCVFYEFDEINERVYAEFIPESDYVSIFSMPVPRGPVVESYNIMLYEGDYQAFEGFEPYVPAGFVFQETGSLAINYDNMMTLEEIEALIVAKDAQGNIIDKSVLSDTFSSSQELPGEYEIIFQTESNLIEKTYLLNILIYDATAPVIEGEDRLTFDFSEKPTIDAIKMLYTATDNVDDNVEIIASSDTYQNANDIGTYEIQLVAKDRSNNETIKDIYVELTDDIPPVFQGPTDVYVYATDEPYTYHDIENMLSAEDAISGPCDLRMETDNYNSTQQPGIYEIVFSSSDYYDNMSFRTVYIHVIDNRGPSFVTNELIIETTSTQLWSDNDVISSFTAHMETLNVKAENIHIEYNEYEKNKTKAGDYYVYLNYDVDGVSSTARVLITVQKEKWSFSPYYLFGLIPIIGAGFIAFLKFRRK